MNNIFDEDEIIDIWGKSIWAMTPQELYERDLIHTWVTLIDEFTENEE